MIYTANITTTKSTPKTALKKTVLHVNKGLVYKVEIYVPPGAAGLLGVSVFDGLYQVWPSSVGEFFVGDDIMISFDDLFLKEAAPYQFQICTYNEDDTYDHTCSVRVGLVSNEAFMARFLPTKSREYFEKMRLRLLSEQTKSLAKQLEGM